MNPPRSSIPALLVALGTCALVVSGAGVMAWITRPVDALPTPTLGPRSDPGSGGKRDLAAHWAEARQRNAGQAPSEAAADGPGAGPGASAGSNARTPEEVPAPALGATPDGANAGAPAAASRPLVVQIRTAMRAHLPALRRCYETALRADDGLAGRVTLDLEIRPDGTVALGQVGDASFEGHSGAVDAAVLARVVGCLDAAAADMRFEMPPGTVEPTMVRYPIVFTNEREGI